LTCSALNMGKKKKSKLRNNAELFSYPTLTLPEGEGVVFPLPWEGEGGRCLQGGDGRVIFK